MNWYYAKDNHPVGPLSDADFQQAVNSGNITPETMVWNETMTGWSPYSTVSTPRPAIIQPPEQPPTTGTCSECGQQFQFNDMISYEGKTICAACKTTFFQRLQEGAANAGRTPNHELMAKARASLKNAWWFGFAAMLVLVILEFIAGLMPYCIGYVISTILGGAFMIGRISFTLHLARNGREGLKFAMIFDGFTMFGQALVQYLVFILMIAMWSTPAILLCAGGGIALAFKQMALGAVLICLGIPLMAFPIIYGYSYAMTFYVLHDNRTMGPFLVLKKSTRMMTGRKMKFFLLQFRFIGWALLALVPAFLAGIPFLAMIIKDHDAMKNNLGYFIATLALFVLVAFICMLAMIFVNLYITVSTAHFYDDVKDRAMDMQA